MKGFLIGHGEKLFLVVVALVAGWSLFQSLKSLGTTENVSEADENAIDKIARELATKKAPQRVPAPYGDWLQANLDGHGIYALATGKFPSPRVYEPPFQSKKIHTTQQEVPGRIPLPVGLKAEPDRAKITFSWTASAARYMNILRYEVFRREEGGPWSAEPVYTGNATSFEDRSLSPETEYAYKIRVVGVPDTSDPKMKVIPSPSLVKQGAAWLTAFVGDAGNVKAMTPSNVDFECSNVFTKFGEKYANILIKRWNSDEDDWDQFATEYEDSSGVSVSGIAVGQQVVGRRIPRKGEIVADPNQLKIFDSKHVLKEIKREVIFDEVEVRYKKADGSWGVRIAKVPKVVHNVLLENTVNKAIVTVPVGKGKATIEKKKAEPKDKPDKKKPTGAPDGLDDFKKLFESSSGTPQPEKASGGEMRPQAVAPRAAPAVSLAEARTAIRLTFPDGWVATGDMAGDLGARGAWGKVLEDGKAAVYKGTAPNSGVVIADRPFGEDEQRHLMPGLKVGASDADTLRSLAAGVQRLTGRTLMDVEGYESPPDIQVIKTAAGKPVSSWMFSMTHEQGKTVVKRYYALSSGRLYSLAFVCLEKDIETQQKVFDEMVSSWTW